MTETTRTIKEALALALERVNALIDAGFHDLSAESPLLGTLDAAADHDILEALAEIGTEMQTRSAANPTPRMAWEAVNGGLPNWSWWHNFEYLEEGTDWETPGTLRVTGEDPNDEEKSITRSFTAADLLQAYWDMPNKTHCGGCSIIGDSDDCSSDLILQWAMYGEIVFG